MPPASRDGCNYPDARKRCGTSVAKIGRKQCHDCTFSTTTFVPVQQYEFISYERRKNSIGSEGFDVSRWRGIKRREKKIKGDRGRSRKFLSIKPSLFLGARRLKSFRVKGAKNGGLSSPLFGLRDRGREGRERRGVSGARGKEREKASKEGTKTPVN